MNYTGENSPEVIDEGISLKELVGIARKYMYLILLIVCSALVAAGLYLFISEPVYEASGQLLVDSPKSSPLMEQAMGLTLANSPLILNTAVERIKGRSITDSVVVKTNSFVVMRNEALDAMDSLVAVPPEVFLKYKVELMRNSKFQDNNADFRVVDERGSVVGSGYFGKTIVLKNLSFVLNREYAGKNFVISIYPVKSARAMVLGSLKVSNIRNTNIVQLSVRSTSPLRAKQIVDAYATEFAQMNLFEKREEATASKDFLDKQFVKINEQLQDTENDYQQYKTTKGFIALDEQTVQYINRLGSLEEKRFDYQIKMNEASAAKEKSERVLGGDPELQKYLKINASPFFQENTILQGLYTKIAELQVENAKLRAEYSPSHPLLMQNESELAAAKKQLEEATTSAVLNATQGSDPLLSPVVQTLVANTINFNGYSSVLKQIDSEVKKLDGIMASLPEAEVEQAQLERRMRINEQIYNLLLSRLHDARIMEASTISDVRIINRAELPSGPVSPNKQKILLLALVAGLFLSGGTVFGFEQFKTSFSTIESIERECTVPVISIVPHLTKKQSVRKREIAVGFEKSDEANKRHAFELFNTLRMNLMFSDNFKDSKTLVVTSSMPKEGKSFISANLAVTIAHAGMKVLLVDCDFRHPVLHQFFNVPNSPGIIERLEGSIQDNGMRTVYPNLSFLPVGSSDDSLVITEVINNTSLVSFIESMKQSFDLIIVDTPPVNLFTDAVVLSSHFKNVLLAVKYNSNKDAVLYSKKVLSNVNASILGIVVNDVQKSKLLGAQYGYGYGSGYGYGYGYGHGYGYGEEYGYDKQD